MESIVKYLRVKLGANIATLKSKFADLERKYSGNEYYEEFMGIINKAEYSIEDINDLLLCYSDHDLSLEEILSLVSKDEPIYYDKDNFGTSFQINTFLLYFLLSSKNTEVIKGILKLFSTENLRINRNFEFANYCTLREFNTFYDIYYNLDTILNCKNEELQKKRAICFMYYIDELSCLEELKHIGITIEDVESFIKEYEATGKLLDGFSLGRLFQKVSFVNDKEFGSDKLYLKVKDEYNKYISSHDNFKLEDFIAYYNENFADDFSVFNYKDGEKVLLDERMLYLILSSYGYNYFKTNIACYGEFIDEFMSLKDSKKSLDKAVCDYIARDSEEYETRKIVIEKYGHLIEELKKPFTYTYKYFIYINVAPEYRAAFRSFVAWHYVYAKSFDRDIRNSSKAQKDETFKVILKQCEDEIINNFNDRNNISKKYFEFVKEYVGDKYISAKRWKEQIETIVDSQIAIIAKEMFTKLARLIDNEGFSIVSYIDNNSLCSSLSVMGQTLKRINPEYSLIVDKVLAFYDKEMTSVIEEKRRVEKEKKVQSASDIITRFLDKNYKNKKDFLEAEGLTEAQFDRMLELIEQEDFELFVKFMNKFNSLKSQRYAILMKTVDVVLAALVNGVNENGVVRPFNFLDFSLLTKLPFDRFAVLVVNSNKLNNTNIRQFRQFERAVRSYKMVTNEYIFTEKHIVMLNGAQHEVTYDEKALALAYLRKHNLSNYYVLYKTALQKVLRGQITKESLGLVPVSDDAKLSKKIS